jgi:ADP-ribosylglycohydrolase
MIGAIVGDIVGSVYEWSNIKTKNFPLFGEDNFFTDDTVMTVAVAEALINGGKANDFVVAMKKFGKLYPDADYGGNFGKWLLDDDCESYFSYGNGSAMRVSPIAWHYNTLKDTKRVAQRSAAVTHNHPEGIKGAQAVAVAIYLARKGISKSNIKNYIENKYGYNLSRTLDEIRPLYEFDVSCQGSVPHAITAFLESTSFEDAVRNAVSIGGDSDTIAAITGSIAEAAYGIPNWIKEKALSYLNSPLLEVYTRWASLS